METQPDLALTLVRDQLVRSRDELVALATDMLKSASVRLSSPSETSFCAEARGSALAWLTPALEPLLKHLFDSSPSASTNADSCALLRYGTRGRRCWCRSPTTNAALSSMACTAHPT